jgi:hypothetical protein
MKRLIVGVAPAKTSGASAAVNARKDRRSESNAVLRRSRRVFMESPANDVPAEINRRQSRRHHIFTLR